MSKEPDKKPEELPEEKKEEKKDKPAEDENDIFDLELIEEGDLEIEAGLMEITEEPEEKKEKKETVQIIGFYLDDSLFGVDISHVIEIIRFREITPLPESPHYVKGILNLRGKVVPIFSLRAKTGFQEKEDMEKGRIIVIENPQGNYGFIVDSVTEVLRIDNSSIEPTPELISGISAEYITGLIKLDDKLLIFLNVNRIFESGSAF